MSSPFVAEIRPWALNFAPRGWAMAQGQILPISQYTALFSLIGTYYGGNGTSNFQLPDLRSRVPMKYGSDPVGNQYVIGEEAGEENVTISSLQMPIHTHNVFGSNAPTGNNAVVAAGTAMATNDKGNAFYAPGANANQAINAGTVSMYMGGNQAHTNLQPYLAINWCIALVGIYPSRN
jgi:microcystin-dependent protein